MKNLRSVPGVALLFVLISLACNALQPIPTPPTPMLPISTLVPATPTAVPSPTAGSRTTANYPSRIVYNLFVANEGIFIHTVDANGDNDVRLTGNDCLGLLPTWSSDGALIAYYCYNPDEEKANLWVMKTDGSEARFVAELPDILYFKWSPDNKQLVYHAPQPDGSENDIYVLDMASGTITDLTKDSLVWDAFPDWSPDGNLIVFTSDRAPDGKALDDVWTMKPDGSGLVNLTNNGADWEDYHPAWSPDGKFIAFFRTGNLFDEDLEGGPAGLWVMDMDGKNQKLVTALEGFRMPGAAVWSPDGQYLAYVAGLDEEQDIWVVPAAGGEPVKVSEVAGVKNGIAWSPDSKALIFTNDDDTADTLLIYIALPDGSDTHLLLDATRFGFGDWAP